MSAKTLWPLVAFVALSLLGACLTAKRSGDALCVNPTTQQVEQCCVGTDGSYVACSTVPGGSGDALGGNDAGSSDTSGGGEDGVIPTGDGVVAVDAGTPVDDTGTLVDDTGTPVGDTGTPIDDTGTPVDDTGTPIDDTGTPVGDTGIPIDDTGTPIDDTDTPIDDTGTPIDDTGTPVDDTGSCQECLLGDETCDDAATRKVCEETTPGCTAWSYVDCSAGTTCAEGVCVTSCDVELPCATPGQKKCGGSIVQVCTEVAPGCAGWMNEKTCSADETCKGGACVAVVECPALTKCTLAGQKKCDGAGMAVIACEALPADPTCLQWVAVQTCEASQVCENAACVTEGTLTCNEYIVCSSECGNESCVADCTAMTTASGLAQFDALETCATTSCDGVETSYAFQACYFEKCQAEVLGCEGYFSFGTGSCSGYLDCSSGCLSDSACISDCFDAIDYDAYVLLLKLYVCLEASCDPYYPPGTADYSTCLQNSCGAFMGGCKSDL